MHRPEPIQARESDQAGIVFTAGEHTLILNIENAGEPSVVIILNIVVQQNYLVMGVVGVVLAAIVLSGIYPYKRER